jgi:MFS transporter, DHA2 family, multidrug resistance protein
VSEETGIEEPPRSSSDESAAGGRPGLPFGPDGHPRRWKILGVLVVSLLIVVLDNTVLNIALPTIQRDLNASQSQLVWSVDSYVLAFAALLFTWGVLGDKYGRKRVLSIGLVVFAIGSALSAIATGPNMLIAFRTVMGIGGAAVMPVTLAIITVVFPPKERGKAIGSWAAAVGAAVALGPVLGGLLLENPQWSNWLIGNDWGSVFLINVPIIAIGLIGVWRVVPETHNDQGQHLDPFGLLLSVAGLVLVIYGIIHADDTKDWWNVTVLGPIVTGIVVLTLFIILERRASTPSFDVGLFRSRSFSTSIIAASMAFFAISGVTFLLPFYLQVVRGYSTLDAGLCFLPFALGQLVSAPNSARMVHYFGERIVISTGLGVVALSTLLLGTLEEHTSLWQVLGIFLVFGLGMGNVIAPASTVVQNALPLSLAGAGSAVQNTVRQVAGALGIAIVGTVLSTRYAHYLAPTLDQLPAAWPEPARSALSTSVAAVPPVLDQARAYGAPETVLEHIRAAAFDSFVQASHVTTWINVAILLFAMVVTALFMPTRVPQHHPEETTAQELVSTPE